MDVSTKNFLIMLTNEQIQQLKQYCLKSGVPYYEVQVELVDHMAEWMEARLQTPGASFEKVFPELKFAFSPKVLRQIQTEKEKHILRAYLQLLNESWLAFFTWPKILVLICLYLFMWLIGPYIKTDELILVGISLINLYGAGVFMANNDIVKKNRDEQKAKLLSVRVSYYVTIGLALLVILQYYLFWWNESTALLLASALKWVYPLFVLLMASFYHTQVNFHKKLRERYQQAFN
jgi:hypothetical protein